MLESLLKEQVSVESTLTRREFPLVLLFRPIDHRNNKQSACKQSEKEQLFLFFMSQCRDKIVPLSELVRLHSCPPGRAGKRRIMRSSMTSY